ncbi:hypothetical protein HY407_04255 [Candidatus Gottesmanbacteria bacterium]|nr:hypothetical protein [Candidatus Gottesmanbacteria bacterium]
MPKFKLHPLSISFDISESTLLRVQTVLAKHMFFLLLIIFTIISIYYFQSFYTNKLGLSYNDARSHLDIGRRVVEGLKPGLAQLGSVWLPLPHILMIPTIWNDFMWHSGLAGSLQSMISFVVTGLVIYSFLKILGVGMFGRLLGVFVFVANLNILYLQSVAMTELLLISTMTIGVYELVLWAHDDKIVNLVKSAFWVMLSTLVRYDGWFLLIISTCIVAFLTWKKRGYKTSEGLSILFVTLAGLGVVGWFVWNQLIFKDALYFALGPFSARVQQQQMEKAGALMTKGDLLLSTQVYLYALFFNSGTFTAFLGLFGAIAFWLSKNIKTSIKIASLSLLTPLLFNIIALFFGHSVLFVQGISGNTWFNVRYGIMMMPSIAIFIGYLAHKVKSLRWVFLGLLFFVTFFAFNSSDAVTIDDARVGSSQKNVSEVSGWLSTHAKDEKGFILISAASHDAIIFSSGLPMKKFIHEGTGAYWESATIAPDRWARWIVMRTHDDNDLSWKFVSRAPGFVKYEKTAAYPFADIYQLKDEFLGDLNTEPVFGKQK